ncbi:hypothetical protein IGI04_028260 [Brassica rapa subsp. trilocularis]|uniref:Uncharacterized protein n=1 Tax=Brassica rapa subsp. trilocularis TaxID=1813537 RepID=A0ABQ7L1J8_BRACM|nr:hypothetical protein IGI04_028260 [Brassica rapa subsp. trilocularis]
MGWSFNIKDISRGHLDKRSFISDRISTLMLISGACVWSHSDNEDPVEELPRCSAQKIHQKNIAEKFNATMLRSQLQYRDCARHEHSTRRPRAEFLGIQKSHKTVFPGLEFGSRVSKNDYVPSYGSLILGFSRIRSHNTVGAKLMD